MIICASNQDRNCMRNGIVTGNHSHEIILCKGSRNTKSRSSYLRIKRAENRWQLNWTEDGKAE